MSNSYIWVIDKTLSGATTPMLSRSVSNGNEKLLNIPQSSQTGASPSDCFMSYSKHSLGESYPLCRDTVGVFHNPAQLGGNCLVLYPGHTMWESYPSPEMPSMYSTTPVNLAIFLL